MSCDVPEEKIKKKERFNENNKKKSKAKTDNSYVMSGLVQCNFNKENNCVYEDKWNPLNELSGIKCKNLPPLNSSFIKEKNLSFHVTLEL